MFLSQNHNMNWGDMRPTERLFCRLLADVPITAAELEAQLKAIGEEALWEISIREDADSIVGARVAAICTANPNRWLQAANRVRATLTLYLEQLDRVAAALAEEGIALVALKNSGIARGLFPDLAGCPMGDIDVLVAQPMFRRAHAVMIRLGFVLGDRSPFKVTEIGEAERHGGAEYMYKLTDGSTLWFELQWRPVAGRWIRPDQEPLAEDLIARAVSIPDTAVHLLAPEDNLLQVCLHTAKHSYVRAPGFRLHTDVDRIVRRSAIDWELFCSQVERIGVRTAVYLSLRIPAVMLATPVPAEVLARLDFAPRKHRLLLRWLARVGWFNPKQKKWSKIGYIGFNLLLYDSVRGIVRAVFPESSWMVKRYEIKRRWTLPVWYFVRAFKLLFERANT